MNPSSFNPLLPSRRLVLAGAASALAFTMFGPVRGAAALLPTPRQTEGPFYPVDLPPDIDNDLLSIGDGRPAQGIVTHVSGRVLDASSRPLAGTTVEIWQCDANGRYHHPGDNRGRPRDDSFQGFGRTLTDGEGAWRFRTIRPVAYAGRTPHIHFAVMAPGHDRFVTQMYVAGEPGNERDFVLNGVRDPAARARLIVPLAPAPELEPEALAGRFEIVLPGAA